MKTTILTIALLCCFCITNAQSTIKRNTNKDNVVTSTANKKRSTPANSYKVIDLGLPSGTKWADRNVGARSPEDYGGLYPFGNPWCTMKKNEGFYDVSNIIGTQYDIAKAKMGGSWRTPSAAQLKELVDNCTFSKIAIGNFVAAKVVGPNGNFILLPLGGTMYNFGRSQGGEYGIYESGDRNDEGKVTELHLFLGKSVEIVQYGPPSGWGRSVRGVCR